MSSVWKLRSIRSRLTVWYALLFLVAMLLLGAGVAWRIEQQLRDDVDVRLQSTAQAMREQVEMAFIEGRPTIFLPSDAFTFPSQLVQVMTTTGQIRFSSENLGNRTLPFDPEELARGGRYNDTVTVDGVTIRVHFEPIRVNDQLLGWVVAGQPMIQLVETLEDLQRTFIVAAVFGSVLAALGGWFIARRAFRPVDEMTSTARRIASAAEDALPLETRLAAPQTGDEIARLGETFNSLLDRLQDALELQRRFVADASHELRTPLTAVQGNVDLLERQMERRGAESPETTETIGELRRESQRMTRLVTDLLTLARLESGGAAPVDLAAAPLMPAVRNAVRTASAMHPETPFGIDVEAPVTIQTDQGRLEQVLVILLDNAALHSSAGMPVSVRVLASNETAEIAVVDKGAGIPAADIPHIFERFYRADTARGPQRGGSGLGLPIAQAIVRAHGGTIEVASVEGEGTTMTVRLPIVTHPASGQPKD
ncbi:MAG: HAMP domain-containing histidine kinase [Thermomicrobiales bacterium]|nr:HAMP domain-containing histidine kinase [Thermomicrobiales bacterium]